MTVCFTGNLHLPNIFPLLGINCPVFQMHWLTGLIRSTCNSIEFLQHVSLRIVHGKSVGEAEKARKKNNLARAPPRGTPYNGPKGKAPPERGTFSGRDFTN